MAIQPAVHTLSDRLFAYEIVGSEDTVHRSGSTWDELALCYGTSIVLNSTQPSRRDLAIVS